MDLNYQRAVPRCSTKQTLSDRRSIRWTSKTIVPLKALPSGINPLAPWPYTSKSWSTQWCFNLWIVFLCIQLLIQWFLWINAGCLCALLRHQSLSVNRPPASNLLFVLVRSPYAFFFLFFVVLSSSAHFQIDFPKLPNIQGNVPMRSDVSYNDVQSQHDLRLQYGIVCVSKQLHCFRFGLGLVQHLLQKYVLSY